MVGSLVRAGANVSLSSDVVSSDEVPRSNPFVGLEMAVTRQEYTGAHPLQVPPLIAERLTVAQAVDGYTMAGARQLGQAGELGSLAAGKLADFIVLDHNPFEVPASSLHRVRVRAVVVDGVLVHGTLGRRPTAP
jgi:predicted amidohydrolase YtcJ